MAEKRSAEDFTSGIPKKMKTIFDTIEGIKFMMMTDFSKSTYNNVFQLIQQCANISAYSINTCLELIASDFDDAPGPWTIAHPGIYHKDGKYYSILQKVDITPSYIIHTILKKMIDDENIRKSEKCIWIGDGDCPQIIKHKQFGETMSIIYIKQVQGPGQTQSKDLDETLKTLNFVRIES